MKVKQNFVQGCNKNKEDKNLQTKIVNNVHLLRWEGLKWHYTKIAQTLHIFFPTIEKHHNGMLYNIEVQNIWRSNKHCTQSWEFRWEASKGMFGIRKKNLYIKIKQTLYTFFEHEETSIKICLHFEKSFIWR